MDVRFQNPVGVSFPKDPVVPSEKVGLGWVPGGFKYLLRRYLDS